MENNYILISLDPGRKSVFTATDSLKIKYTLEVHNTTSEYYHLTGSAKFSKEQNRKKAETGIDLLENNIPSPKISDILVYNDYVR